MCEKRIHACERSFLSHSPTSVVSLLRRLVMSPVLVTSKNPLYRRNEMNSQNPKVATSHRKSKRRKPYISWAKSESMSFARRRTFTRPPTTVKMEPRNPANTPAPTEATTSSLTFLMNPGTCFISTSRLPSS